MLPSLALSYNKAINGAAIWDACPLLTNFVNVVPIFLVTWTKSAVPYSY